MIAIGGGYGTLTEISFALRLGKPVVFSTRPDDELVHAASTPQDAVTRALARI